MHLILLAAAPLDTVITRLAPVDATWSERVWEILRALVALAFLGLTVSLAAAAWKFRKGYHAASTALDRVHAELTPIAQHATRVAENLEHVTTAVRSELARVTALVARTERRIDETLARAEARARDLEALLDVAQHEAEHSLVAAAATVAGVRESFAALRDELAGIPRRAGEPDDEVNDHEFDHSEFDDAVADADARPRPRIRTRDA